MRRRTGSGRSDESVAIESALKTRVTGHVRFDAGTRALYSTDASNYRQVPIGVVVPRSADDVVATVATCREHHVPVLARGCGTSLAGQCCNVAVVIDFSKYLNRVIEVDAERRLARVQPGAILDDLRAKANRFGLTFGPDPSTHSRCTMGGMLGNNACGVHSILGGMTSDNVEEMEVLLYDGTRLGAGRTTRGEVERRIAGGGRVGQIYQDLDRLITAHAEAIRTGFPDIPRRVSGYNLPALLPERGFNVARSLVGSEGTCVTILEATVNLIPWPAQRVLVVLGYPDVYAACDDVTRVMEYGPIGLEGFDEHLLHDMRSKNLDARAMPLLPQGRGFLMVEFGGETAVEATATAEELIRTLPRGVDHVLYVDPVAQRNLWRVREEAVGAASIVPGEGEYWPGWEDSAVAPGVLGSYLRDMRRLLDGYGYRDITFYGHFGQGCTHMRVDFDFRSRAGIERFDAFMSEAADLCVSYGGSLSGEHGDGQARGQLLPRMFSPQLMTAFSDFKAIWDPDDRMNPGKLVHPNHMDQDLRLGIHYNPPAVTTHFQFPSDGGSFAAATRRCVGMGICRRTDGGLMCPSFQVTREEKHSTRGRAHLLFEMLDGGVIADGWRDEAVKESLDLCLACKGCKSDCPVRVDMATYKAEFLSHYYARRLRPRAAYAMGFIHHWARLAMLAPNLVNLATSIPLLSSASRFLAGVSQHRTLPRFAPQSFKRWYANRQAAAGTPNLQHHAPAANGAAGSGLCGRPSRTGINPAPTTGTSPSSVASSAPRKRVILFADTFNDFFTPEIAIAATEVLEAFGYAVVVPMQDLCCGRPLYDYGFLDTARKRLLDILDALKDDIEAGTPMIVLEPSCAATFRDELIEMLPHNQNARRLARQTFVLSEFLVREGIELPRAAGKAIVQGHCHHSAIFGTEAEQQVLEALEVEYVQPNLGCCGMAGSFGFESDHYDISIAIGERHLLPAIRHASEDTMLIANGFSCREQIAQTTSRRSLHLAQVLQLALTQHIAEAPRSIHRLPAIPVLAGAALLAAAALAIRRR